MNGMRIGGLALVLALAACGEASVTAPDVAPRFDGSGGTYGGGFAVEPAPTSAGDTDTCTNDGRGGGGTYGGGFNVAPPCPDPIPTP